MVSLLLLVFVMFISEFINPCLFILFISFILSFILGITVEILFSIEHLLVLMCSLYCFCVLEFSCLSCWSLIFPYFHTNRINNHSQTHNSALLILFLVLSIHNLVSNRILNFWYAWIFMLISFSFKLVNFWRIFKVCFILLKPIFYCIFMLKMVHLFLARVVFHIKSSK